MGCEVGCAKHNGQRINIRQAIRGLADLGLADQGLAVVAIASYFPEVMMLSDRILVSRQGRIVQGFANKDVSEADIMYASIH
jgi:ABC-type sugar transport system ATPase subunit